MSHGVIAGFTEIVEWKIPNFSSINRYYIDSPPFSLVGYTLYLRLYPKSSIFTEYVTAGIYIDDAKFSSKSSESFTITLGLKTVHGTVEENGNGRIFEWFELKQMKERHFPIPILKINNLEKRKSELLPSDALTVTCRIQREKLSVEKVAQKPEKTCFKQMMLAELETLSSDLSDLLSSDRKHDVTIVVQGTEFHAHRTILSARSSVFRAMYEHDTAEARSGVLTVPDCDPNSFHDFLRYLYTGKMEEVTFQTAYHLYGTAEKYDVQTLKSFCANYLKENLTTESICIAVCLADKYGDDDLMSASQKFFNKNSCKIFLTSEWSALLLKSPRLSDKLLKAMATFSLKKS